MPRHRTGFAVPGALVVLTVACLSAGAAAPPPARPAGLRPWTGDELLALRVVTDPQIAPDGQRIAYVVSSLNAEGSDYQTDVWLVPAEGNGPSGAARRLTTSNTADEAPRWSPDGKTLAFLSDRPRPGAPAGEAARDDEGKRQIWMIRVAGGEAWCASSSKGGVSSYEWSRDGGRIAYLAREPKTESRRQLEQEKDDAVTPEGRWRWSRLWVLDVARGRASAVTPEQTHVTGFSFAPDGRRLAIAVQPTPLLPDVFRSDLYVVAADGSAAAGTLAPLVRRTGLDIAPRWSPDGRSIAFVSQDGREEWFRNTFVCVVPAEGGTPKNLTASFDERVDGPGGPTLAWLPDSRGVMFQASQRTAQHLFRAGLGGEVTPLTAGPELNFAASLDGSGERVAFLRESSESPREVWLREGESEPRRITDVHPEAREHPAYRKELVRWQGEGGMEIEGLLIQPAAAKSGQRVPLLLNVHGGPAGTHSNTWSAASRVYPWPLFAQQGWAILLPNPRGSGGYGEAFRGANRRDWGGKDYEDLVRGVDALIERGIADPARLAVCGWSYGGYMSAMMVTRTSRFRAALVGAGVTNLASMTGTSDIPEFNRSAFDAWPWEDPAEYVEHSPLFHAGRVATPTLLIHGEADERVPVSQSWEFYNALKKVGVPVDLLLLPRQPHGPREPRQLKRVQEWQLDWLERYALAPREKPAARLGATPDSP